MYLSFRAYSKEVGYSATNKFMKLFNSTFMSYEEEDENEDNTETDVTSQAADGTMLGSISTWF